MREGMFRGSETEAETKKEMAVAIGHYATLARLFDWQFGGGSGGTLFGGVVHRALARRQEGRNACATKCVAAMPDSQSGDWRARGPDGRKERRPESCATVNPC